MYSEKLELLMADDTIETDDFRYSYADGQLCNLCDGKCGKSYTVYLYDDKIRTKSCYFCYCIVNFRNLSTGKCFLVSSKLSQADINKKYLENITCETPDLRKPTEIDPNCEIIQMPIFKFVEYLSQMTQSEKKIFVHVKVMFTNESTDYLKSGSQYYFGTEEINKIKYDVSYFKIDVYNFSKKESEIFNKLLKNTKINKKILKIKSSLEKCIKDTNVNIKIVKYLN
jgi:hypothetical protein